MRAFDWRPSTGIGPGPHFRATLPGGGCLHANGAGIHFDQVDPAVSLPRHLYYDVPLLLVLVGLGAIAAVLYWR